MARVVVIGGGIAGLAAAHALRGHDVTIIEGATQVGGKLRTSSIGGLDVDEGAEQFLVRVPEATALVHEVGLGGALVHPATSHASVWTRGQLRPLPSRTVMGVPSSVWSLRHVLTVAELARASLDLALPGGASDEDESVADRVGRRLGRGVVDRLVDPLLGGVYAGRAAELSVRATLPQLPDTRGSLIRAVRRTMPAPSTVASAAPVFASLRGGLQQLAVAVAATSGAELVTGRLVRGVTQTPTGFDVVHGPTIDARSLSADAVVVAVPPAAAARLLADVAATAAAALAQIEAASTAIVTLGWPREALPALHGSGYLVPATEGRPVKAATFSSHKWSHLGDGDVSVVRCSIGRHGDVADLQRDDDELAALAVRELHASLGFNAEPVDTRVSRWGGGLPQYAVGHVDRVRRIRTAVGAVPGLAVCGAAYDGIGIPACIRSGQQAAAQVLSALGLRS